MKVLFLVETPQCVKLLEEIPDIKIIRESELVENTPWQHGLFQIGYSNYVVSRASNLSKIYRFSKPLAFVLDQRHHNAVDKITHDMSIRVINDVIAKRLHDSVLYKCDKTYYANELTLQELRDIFGL